MNTDKNTLSTETINALTERIIGCVYRVANTLGCGFLEKGYENALAIELRAAGFSVEQQAPILVKYRDLVVGEYFADLRVDGVVVIELKAVKTLDEIHTAQCLNYLKATGHKICLLVNFGSPRVQLKRLML